jgi:hypothetical protein
MFLFTADWISKFLFNWSFSLGGFEWRFGLRRFDRNHCAACEDQEGIQPPSRQKVHLSGTNL